MKRVLLLTVAVAVVGSFAWTGASGAQTSTPTLTLEERCVQNRQYLDFIVKVTISGLDPFATVHGSIDFPDGNRLVGNISADETGVATTSAANNFPGVITVTITSPFSETKSIDVECGTHIPTDKAQCKKRGWHDYGFKNNARCAEFVRQMKLCAELHYQSIDPPYCPPQPPEAPTDV